jgi:hypothetical protein
MQTFINILLVFFLILCILTHCKKLHASESPQRDLYKIDARDGYFNLSSQYALNQPELKGRAKGSDGDRLLNELKNHIPKRFIIIESERGH